MNLYQRCLDLLRTALASPTAEFRAGQWQAIEALVAHKRRLLVVERTGWGKSMVYFLATRILRDQGAGATLIVSPLLALMRNQLEAAQRLHIRAASINSTNTEEWKQIREAVLADQVDALLIAPERLANEDFLDQVLLPLAPRIGLLVVDEAHCISDWGHDFRPDYRRLGQVLRRMPPTMPLLGTTATANNRVITDVRRQMGDVLVQRGPLRRESLSLQTLRLDGQPARLAWLAEHIPQLPGTGIIYALTQDDTERVAAWLRMQGIEAAAYHSKITHEGFRDSNHYRQHLEQRLQSNDLKALVATTALGMGYDKPDLGFVVHFQAPSSIVAYYQQVGRAGRAIPKALGILLAGREDGDIQDYFRRSAFPDQAHVSLILQALAASDGLSIRQLEQRLNLRYGQIEKALKLLAVENPAPVIKDGSQWRRTPLPYQPDPVRLAHLTRQRELEWHEVQGYVDHGACLMAYLARHLDDPDQAPCGRCANCLGRPLVAGTFSGALAQEAARFLRGRDFHLTCNRQVAADAFPTYGFRGNLGRELQAETGRILCHWGDSGWGYQVTEDKHHGHFRDELVTASAELLQQRWRPNPAPTWVCCVPSQRHPQLVPDFARRLAGALGLPFVPALSKVRDNEAQKRQQNRFHQCHNLDGVFQVASAMPHGPVLLVDDVVDSAWTLTVCAALLRQAGSGPVWPFALASTATDDSSS